MVLPQFVGIRFQVLFHSPLGVLFTFPSRYWFTIGRQGVFSLRRWSSLIPTGFHVPRGTRVLYPESRIHFAYGTITFYGSPFQGDSTMNAICNFPRSPKPSPIKPLNPGYATLSGCHAYPVWAVPGSLAATSGITFVFFS